MAALPPLLPVKSSNISAVGYDEQSQALFIRFKSGSTYRYDAVPPDEYQALATAGSVGAYFAASIKDQYPTTRV